MNTQPIQKPTTNVAGNLDVHSVFYTIQGEGPFCGQPAVFVRLWGCNLQCPGCDTEYTSIRETLSPAVLADIVSARNRAATLVVITGGEPLRQNLTPFVLQLLKTGYRVQIETNGTLPLPQPLEGWVSRNVEDKVSCFVVCSPKAGKVNKALQPFIVAYKYVGGTDLMEDGLPRTALEHTAKPHLARPHEGFEGTVYLQPVDAHNKHQNLMNLRACVASVLEHGYTLQLQTHKLIGVE